MNQSVNSAKSPTKISQNSWFKQLKVSQKISLGYAVTLSIAVFGTMIGIIIGQRNQELARQFEGHAQEEIDLLSSLQTNLLQIRTHQQQLSFLITQPQQFEIYNAKVNQLIAQNNEILAEIAKFIEESPKYGATQKHNVDLKKDIELLKNLEKISLTYIQELQLLTAEFKQIDRTSAQDIAILEKKFLKFNNSNSALKWDFISEQLAEILKDANAEEIAAETGIKRASYLQVQIIIVSIVLSVAIAIIIAFYLSRIITQPLQDAIQVAKQVTKESNFELQIPVTTNDEIGVLSISLNRLITKVKQLLSEQKTAAEQQLLASEKMSSLGRMLAGVAHEINNPVNFMYGNLTHASSYIDDLFDLIDTYQEEISNPPEIVKEKIENIELDFVKEDLPKLLQSMQIGADRTRQIVLSLRNFSRIDETEAHPVDLHDCLDSTLLILHNRIKKGVAVIKNYGDLPQINAYAGSLYQVFMNLISNSLDALEEKMPESPTITITTAYDKNNQVTLKIADNGSGIESENLNKIFDTFFTTKPSGVGTGLGLAISHQIITEKHSGTINCQSEVGKGTEFIITLPVFTPVSK